MFDLWTVGVEINRDGVVYDWQRERLKLRIQGFVAAYNIEVHRHRADPTADWPDHIDWSRDLKQDARRGRFAKFDEAKLRIALYRPFSKQFLFFDRILNEEVYPWPSISGRCIAVTDFTSEKPFMVLATNETADKHLVGGGASCQCFPFSHLKDSAVQLFRQHYSNNAISKESVFEYIYALLHHPDYREKYRANLRLGLPRISFAPDFEAFVRAGKELSRLHVDYESINPYPLEFIENRNVPYSERVTRMKFSKDRKSLIVNDSLTLAGIPSEAFEYRLGSRSAVEWVIDQYQAKGDSDPNPEDDPGYVVRLVGQVVRVSVETVWGGPLG